VKQFFLCAVVAAVAAISAPAQAVTVSFGFTNSNAPGGDGSGKTSPFLSPANVATSNVLVETFDRPNGGCGVNTPANLVSITGGSFGTRAGTISGAAAPAGDTTCFAYGPAIGGTLPDKVTLDYAGLINNVTGPLNYLGLYYGSIDNYNDLEFYGTNGTITTVTGQSLIDLFNGTSGDRTSNASNVYVNLFFAPDELFKGFSFITTGIAFEMDNVAVGNVPEPASLALVAAGLAALGLKRRRKLAP